jgi:hypothetical protein
MVTEVVTQFIQENPGWSVHSDAQTALVNQAEPYHDHVVEELRAHRVRVDFLKCSLTEILENAKTILDSEHNPPQRVIDENAVKRSMFRYCPYFPWC